MSSSKTTLLVAGGGLAAFALALAVGLAPHSEPRLLVAEPEDHGGHHATYHPPVNAPYTIQVPLCLDKPGTATIVDASVVGPSPVLKSYGARSGTGGTAAQVSTPCEGEHGSGEHHVVPTVPFQLEGYSPPRRGTIIRLTYTLDGDDEQREADISLPALTQRQV